MTKDDVRRLKAAIDRVLEKHVELLAPNNSGGVEKVEAPEQESIAEEPRDSKDQANEETGEESKQEATFLSPPSQEERNSKHKTKDPFKKLKKKVKSWFKDKMNKRQADTPVETATDGDHDTASRQGHRDPRVTQLEKLLAPLDSPSIIAEVLKSFFEGEDPEEDGGADPSPGTASAEEFADGSESDEHLRFELPASHNVSAVDFLRTIRQRLETHLEERVDEPSQSSDHEDQHGVGVSSHIRFTVEDVTETLVTEQSPSDDMAADEQLRYEYGEHTDSTAPMTDPTFPTRASDTTTTEQITPGGIEATSERSSGIIASAFFPSVDIPVKLFRNLADDLTTMRSQVVPDQASTVQGSTVTSDVVTTPFRADYEAVETSTARAVISTQPAVVSSSPVESQTATTPPHNGPESGFRSSSIPSAEEQQVNGERPNPQLTDAFMSQILGTEGLSNVAVVLKDSGTLSLKLLCILI